MDRLRAIPQWFASLSRRGQIITAVAGLVVVCCACGGTLAAIGAANGGSGNHPVTQSTATAVPIAHATATHARPTATPKGCQETGATLGGSISAFIAKYGPSVATDPTLYSAYTDAAQDADLLIKPDTGCVSDLVLGAYNATWDINQTFAQCTPFLPAGATQYPGPHPLPASGGTFIDYNSSLGEVIMNVSAGSCELTFGH